MSAQRIAVYGGTFDPPHLGHRHVVETVLQTVQPDELLVIPTGIPPHKSTETDAHSGEHRFRMTQLAFRGLERTRVSELELQRGGRSYTAETLRQLIALYPGASFSLILGSDMLISFDTWRESEWLCRTVELLVLSRVKGDDPVLLEKADQFRKRFGTKIRILASPALELSSTWIRDRLPFGEGSESLDDEVYRYILRHRLYGVRPEADWLRCRALEGLGRHRLQHTLGVEYTAVRLARRWGADEGRARIAALLHDCTKGMKPEEQLKLLGKYGITSDVPGKTGGKLLHAVTGAAVAEHEYAADPETVSAIRWHTTGRRGMSLLEKILYVADYIEPGRDFEGVEEVRALAWRDLDAALLLGLENTRREVLSEGGPLHGDTVAAIDDLKKKAISSATSQKE